MRRWWRWWWRRQRRRWRSLQRRWLDRRPVVQLREVQREEHRGDQLQHAASSLTYVAEATAAIGLVLVDGELVEIVAVGQDWRALAPRAVAPSRRHRVCVPELAHSSGVLRSSSHSQVCIACDRRALRDGRSRIRLARGLDRARAVVQLGAQPAARRAARRVHPLSLCVHAGHPVRRCEPKPGRALVHVRGHGCAPNPPPQARARIHRRIQLARVDSRTFHAQVSSGVSSRRRCGRCRSSPSAR